MAKSEEAEYSSCMAKELENSYVCQPCDADGQKLKAVGYCVNCRDYLCRRCYDGHLIPKPMRKHTLVDEEQMKKIEAKNNSLCSEHEDRQIEYHCPTHSFFGCHLCFFKKHKSCKDVQFIPEVSETMTDAGEYKVFTERLANIATKCKKLSTEVTEKVETTTARHTEAVTAIKKFKIDVIDAAEKSENELLKKVNTVKQEDTAKMTEVSDKCNEILQEVQKIASTVEFLENKQKNRDLYMIMIQSKDSLLSLENDLRAAETNIYPSGLGKLHQTDTITNVEFVQDINIKVGDDASTCLPKSTVFIPGQKLVIADYNNSKVKLLDTIQNKLVSTLTMSSRPYGVCHVTDKQVAVTLPSEKKIALVRASSSLSVERTLQVDGACRGVGYGDGKFVVSFDYNKMEVIDIQGIVLKKVETHENGKALFSTPYQLSVNPESRLIYVSNYSSHNVVCLKFDGTVVARYEDQELKGPWQTVFSCRGAAFVCGQQSHNIHQITEDCKKLKVMFTTANGLSFPESISYCEREDKLYIGLQKNDNLKVFKVIHATL